MTAIRGLDRFLLDDDPARWARGFVRKLAAGRELPEYGSERWQQQPWEMQVASAVLAGECHRRDGLFLAQRIEDELATVGYWQEHDEATAWIEVARSVHALASEPTHADLVARRSA